MELLIYMNSITFRFFGNLFKFQYGATNISVTEPFDLNTPIFKFQYGATNI